MESILLDTDVFSFFFRKDTRCALYRADVEQRRLCLAFQTVAELKMGSVHGKWAVQRVAQLERALRRYVVLPYDAAMADHWAKITAHRRIIGKPIACGDAWIASAALRHDLSLITHNGAHFESIPGLRVVCHRTPERPESPSDADQRK